jgi:hypothetical protein
LPPDPSARDARPSPSRLGEDRWNDYYPRDDWGEPPIRARPLRKPRALAEAEARDGGIGPARHDDAFEMHQPGSPIALGPYRGKGPRGYRRPDERIREDACDALTEDARVDASDMEVSVDQGEITLSGSVDSRATKCLAERVVEGVRGVFDVHNRLRVRRLERVDVADHTEGTEERALETKSPK